MVQRLVNDQPAMSDEAPIIHFPTPEEEQATLKLFAREMQRSQARRDAISQEKVDEALNTVTDYLKTGWTTGGGRRLRQFVWSLWNGYHLLNLYDLSSGLDGRRTEAVIVIFHAAMVDALSEKQKRRMMEESGELARWEQARAETPEDDVVIYPPFPMSTEELRRLAHSAEQFDKRLEQERRAEQERWND